MSLSLSSSLHYKLSNESFRSQSSAGRYNPASALRWWYRGKRQRVILGCGSSDDYAIFNTRGPVESRYVIVVSRNTGLGYCGIEVFPFLTPEPPNYDREAQGPWAEPPTWELFFQNASEAFESDRWEDWSMRTLARRMLEWWQ